MIMNRNKSKHKIRQIENVDGSVISDSFNKYFVSIGPSLDGALPASRVFPSR